MMGSRRCVAIVVDAINLTRQHGARHEVLSSTHTRIAPGARLAHAKYGMAVSDVGAPARTGVAGGPNVAASQAETSIPPPRAPTVTTPPRKSGCQLSDNGSLASMHASRPSTAGWSHCSRPHTTG